jgi:hypothetical protein
MVFHLDNGFDGIQVFVIKHDGAHQFLSLSSNDIGDISAAQGLKIIPGGGP